MKYFLVVFGFFLFHLIQAQNGYSQNFTNNPIERNGDSTLGPSYSNTACGLNYIQSSVYVTDRYTDNPGVGLPASINLSGIPNCAFIQQAYLYWIVSSSSIDPSFVINGLPSNGVLIGSGPDKCWSAGATYHYRADVTSQITGNGTYTVDVGAGVWATDGITLLVIYTDPAVTYKGTMILHDGCIVNVSGTEENYTMDSINACGNSISSSAFMVIGDLQDNVTPPEHVISVGNVTDTFPNDFYNFDTLSPDIPVGLDTLQFTYEESSNADCYSIIATGLYFQTADCGTCTISTSGISLTTSQSADSCQKCNGTAQVIASGGTGSYSYSWTPIPSNGQGTSSVEGLCYGEYTIIVSDGSCNLASETISIDSVGMPPVIDITNSTTFCETDPLYTLVVLSSGGFWSGVGIIDSLNGIFDPDLAGPGNFTISYTIVNSLCSDTDSIQIEVSAMPQIQISPVDGLCESDSSLLLTATPTGGFWSGFGIVDNNIGIFDPSVSGTGIFMIVYEVSDSICSNSDTTQIEIVPAPNALFSFTQSFNNFSFTNLSLDAIDYYWDFGNGDTSTTNNPIYAYPSNGAYLICLTANGFYGCSDTYCDTVLITDLAISNQEEDLLIVYPNPANEFIRIINIEKIVKINLTDISGKMVICEVINSETRVDLPIHSIESGTYFLTTETNIGINTIKIEIVR